MTDSAIKVKGLVNFFNITEEFSAKAGKCKATNIIKKPWKSSRSRSKQLQCSCTQESEAVLSNIEDANFFRTL